ncbi:MAG: glycosyltransferase 61 family protein [Chloroflexota bacterium]
MSNFRKQLSAKKEQLAQAARLSLAARLTPERILHKTAELPPDTFGRLGVLDYRQLVSRATVELDSPELCRFLECQIAVAHDGCRFATEEAGVWTLENVRLEPGTGAVVTADGTLLIDSIKNSGRLRRIAAYGRALPEAKPIPQSRSSTGGYTTIAGTHTGNHFHWLIEGLPRLHSLELVGEPVTLLMPDTLNDMQRATLEMCRPACVTVAYVPGDEWVGVERFILPSYLTRQWDFAYLPSDHLQTTRRRILAGYELDPEHAGRRRLYISRAGAGVRHVVNEAEVIAELLPRGFEVVYLEELPFSEQVSLLHDAALVVAPHGAGLANLLFAGRIPVVELATAVSTPVYFFLALALGQDYRYVFPEGMEPDAVSSMTDARHYSAVRDRDIVVPVDRLKTVLDRIT